MNMVPRKKIILGKAFTENEIRAVAEATLQQSGYRAPEPEPGDLVAGKGVYVGEYSPVDRDGVSLRKIFNVYAAPEDLPEVMNYVDTVKYIAGLKKWHGFDGTNYQTDKEIYAALKDGSYTGGWIIPTRELLVGTEPDDALDICDRKIIQPDNLFDHRNKGAFKGTFNTTVSGTAEANGPMPFHDFYWSSTEYEDFRLLVCNVQFSADGTGGWNSKEYNFLSCRPVRLELKPGQ